MNLESAKAAVLAILREKGRATNSVLLGAVGQDRTLLTEVREDLILNDLAKDKDGVGLVYLGEAPAPGPAPAVAPRGEPPHLEPVEVDKTQVFISYGHVDAFEFASRLRNDLLQRGYKAWMDSKTLQGGTNWVIEIEMGIARSFALIAVLTPHATRKGGWCPKEVLLAYNDGKHIVPVRPFSGNIRSLLLVDLHQVDFTVSYEAGLQELVSTLEACRQKARQAPAPPAADATQPQATPAAASGAPVGETAVSAMPPAAKPRFADVSGIQPFNFAREIAAHLDLFVGRRWLKSRVEHWLADEKHPVFVLIGAPGVGKSAIACWLSQELERQVISLHLCSSRTMRTLDPYEYVAALVRQLVEMLPGFEPALGEADVARRRPTAAVAFEELVVAPLKAMAPPAEPRLLIVDSLDEALIQNGETILDVIVAVAPKLPAWVRLLATTRPEPPVLDRIRGLHSLELQADQRENQQDVADFLAEAVKQDDLRGTLGAATADVARRLVELAHGNFLYARMAVQALQRGELKAADLQRLSGGLEDFYVGAFALHFPEQSEYDQHVRPVLEMLAAAFAPLALSTLQASLGVDSLELRRRLAPLRLYLRQMPGDNELHLAFTHKSLRDWLVTPSLSGRFAIDPVRGHQCLSTTLLDRWTTDAYALRRLPSHLIAAERWDDLVGDDTTPGPLTDLRFIQAKCEAGLVHDLMRDYNAALAALPEFREENERLARHDAAMIAYNKALRVYAVARCDWWFAKEGGETRPEPPYPALPPELRDATEREVPEDTSPRAARLRHFADFVSHHLAQLAQRPEDTMPLAFNQAEAGPVAAQSAMPTASCRQPWLERSPRPPTHPLRPQCLRIFDGHAGEVTCVNVSPDGRRAVSGSWDQTVRVWDLETGQCLRTLVGHADRVNGVSVSPDGRRAVSGSSDSSVRVWDLESGECLRTLAGHSGPVWSVSVSPNGRRAVSGSSDSSLRVWDWESGECLRTLYNGGFFYRVTCVSMSPDGRRAVSSGGSTVSGATDHALRVWDLESGEECLRTFDGHADEVCCVSVSPDGRRAVSGSDDKTLRVWDLETGACLRTLAGHVARILSVSVSPDGRRAVSGSEDRTVRVWDLETGVCLCTFRGHSSRVSSVSVSVDGRRALSGGWDKALRLWNLGTGTSPGALDNNSSGVWSVKVGPDGQCAVSGWGDKTVRVWDLERGRCLRTLEGHATWVASVSVSPDGCRAVSGSGDSALRVWDLQTGACLRTLAGHVAGPSHVSVSPDGRYAVSGSGDNALRVWDLETGACLRTIEGQEGRGYVSSVSLSPDGRRAVTGAMSNSLCVWDLAAGACLRRLEGHRDRVLSVSVSPDGRRAVSGSADKTLRFWDLATGASLRTLAGHAGMVATVSVSPDGRCAVSGSEDRALRVWNLAARKCLVVYHAAAGVSSSAFSPSGGRVVCGTTDGEMHVLTPVNFPPSGPLIVTPVRLWLFGAISTTADGSAVAAPGRWDDHLTCRCAHCGKLFVPPEPVVELGMEGAQVIRKGLWLPDSAYENPRLLAPCPHCGGALKFNPCVVDGRECG